LKSYDSPGIDQILAELIQARDGKVLSLRSRNLLILFGIGKEWHSNERSLLLFCL
jgi:hypothetical protein